MAVGHAAVEGRQQNSEAGNARAPAPTTSGDHAAAQHTERRSTVTSRCFFPITGWTVGIAAM